MTYFVLGFHVRACSQQSLQGLHAADLSRPVQQSFPLLQRNAMNENQAGMSGMRQPCRAGFQP